MKKSLFTFFALAAVFAFSESVYSQTEGNLFHVQTLNFQMPEGGTWSEFDSLTTLVTKNVTNKQNKIVSQRILRHLWGSNSRQLIVITEYRKIEDLVSQDTESDALFAAAWSSDDQRRDFNKAYNKYWTSEHSDEIYREVKSGRK
jgi:ABC-type sulfate transport system substrate-binding protein